MMMAVVAIDRYSVGGDAFHLTGGDPDGRTLRTLLQRVIGNEPVDLVHAHGTGTVVNDPVELAAIEASIPPGCDPPSVYSHKGAMGHSLGAAGLVAVVINFLCHRRGVVPPNVQTREALGVGRVRLDRRMVRREVRRSVAVAAGFGGATAVVGLKTL